MNVTMNLLKSLDQTSFQSSKAETLKKEAYTGDGVHIHSEFLDGLNKADAIAKMNEWLEEHGVGAAKVSLSST